MTLMYLPAYVRVLRPILFTLFVIITFSVAGSDVHVFWKVFFFLAACFIYALEYVVVFLEKPEKWKIKFEMDHLELWSRGKKITLKYSEFHNTRIRMPATFGYNDKLGITSTYKKSLLGYPTMSLRFDCDSTTFKRKVMIRNQKDYDGLQKIFSENFDLAILK